MSWWNPLSYVWGSSIPEAPPYPSATELTAAIRKQRAALRHVETRAPLTGRSAQDLELEARIVEAKKNLKVVPPGEGASQPDSPKLRV